MRGTVVVVVVEVVDMIADGRYGSIFFVRVLIVRIVIVLLSPRNIFAVRGERLRGGRVVSLMVGMGTVFL